MQLPTLRLQIIIAIAVACVSTLAWPRGDPLNETKEQLQLKYDLEAVAHGDSVMVSLSIADLGKLKPLAAVVLSIPGKPGSSNDAVPAEVYLRLATTEKDGKILASAQLSRDLAERATIELVPQNPPDGQRIAGGVWHPIPVKDHIVDAK